MDHGDSAVGHMPFGALSKSLQDLPSSDRGYAQYPSYIAEPRRPPVVGSVATQCLIPPPFGSPALLRLSDAQHSISVIQPIGVSARELVATGILAKVFYLVNRHM
jgi:hypothetical protein